MKDKIDKISDIDYVKKVRLDTKVGKTYTFKQN